MSILALAIIASITAERGEGADDASIASLQQQSIAGNTVAMRALAEKYRTGDGVREDYGQCMRWLVNAATANDAAAMNRLAELYRQPGGGYKPNEAGAAEWAERAKSTAKPETTQPAESAEAMFQRALMFVEGKRVREDRRQALAWMLNAAEAGHAVAMRRVGNHYHYGGVDATTSADWYRRAAEAGDKEAMTKLAAYYDAGKGVAKDPEQAKHWRDRAAAKE